MSKKIVFSYDNQVKYKNITKYVEKFYKKYIITISEWDNFFYNFHKKHED